MLKLGGGGGGNSGTGRIRGYQVKTSDGFILVRIPRPTNFRSTATLLMVSASQLMDHIFGLLLLDVTASIQITNRQSLKTTLVMVLKLIKIIMKFHGIPSNMGVLCPTTTDI